MYVAAFLEGEDYGGDLDYDVGDVVNELWWRKRVSGGVLNREWYQRGAGFLRRR